MLRPEEEEEDEGPSEGDWRENLPSRFEVRSPRPAPPPPSDSGRSSSVENDDPEVAGGGGYTPVVNHVPVVVSRTDDGGGPRHPAKGSKHWRSVSLGNIPTQAFKTTAPAPQTKKRRSSFMLRSTSSAALPTAKRNKRKMKKAHVLTTLKSRKWRLKNLRLKLEDGDALIARRYMSWQKAYRYKRRLGFWSVRSNIRTAERDPQSWTWCVWNIHKGELAFGIGPKPELILEAQMIKIS